jgi:hypothetical protein
MQLIYDISKMDLFITDFLKCLRNRLSTLPVALHVDLPPMIAEHLRNVLPTGDSLGPKSNGSQLKDSSALRVFTPDNLANQALKITREARLGLLEAVCDSARRCAHWYDGCGLPRNCGVGEFTFFWRREDIGKLLVSLDAMGFILSIPIPRIAINRVGTIDLEH